MKKSKNKNNTFDVSRSSKGKHKYRKGSHKAKAKEGGLLLNKKSITVKNKDGTVNKKETARVKENARLMELERKKDMFGKTIKKRITEIPRDAIIQGTRKIMSIIPGAVGRAGKKQLMLNRMAKEVDKQKKTKKNMGSKVYKVDNSGQQMVAKQYGGKIK